MSFSLRNGRILITKGGITKLNTDDKMLHGVSSGLPISGSINIAQISVPQHTTKNTTTTYNLGAVNSFATQLIGAVRFSANNYAAGLAFDRWHMVMGGSVVWIMDGEGGFTADIGDNFDGVYQYVDYHFRISGGQAQMVQRVACSDIVRDYEILSHTIEYKLRAGTWT